MEREVQDAVSAGASILARLRERSEQVGELLILALRGKPRFVVAANRTISRALEMPEVGPGQPVLPWSAVPEDAAEFLLKAMDSGRVGEGLPLLEMEGPPARVFSVQVQREDHEVTGRSYFYFGFVEVTAFLTDQDKAMDAKRMESIGTLASGVAHDFNNLIMAIQGHAEFLQMRGNLDEVATESLERIMRSCASGTDLTRSLLGFARRQKLSMDTITVGAVVKDVVALCQRALGPRVRFDVDQALVPERGRDEFAIYGCFSALSHCLLNLFNNARDAMPNGGTIRVVAEREGSKVILRVEDTGQGMAPEVLEKIFDPFFTTKRSGKGTGLGLSMVQGIMQQHGGSIRIESEVGKGTTVFLTWPALAAGAGT
ncbi:MAG: ATP-binding protein, partial [Verrucomicrobiia bacterium]